MPEAFSGSEKTLRQLKVLYEDADILIINKPSGMLSQKARPEDVSANEYILSYLLREGALTEEEMRTFRPSVCNRLDRNTSGILIAGKTLKGLQEMSKALKERTIQKYYRCVVKGEVLREDYLKGWLVKDERENKVTVSTVKPKSADSAPIETAYRPIWTGGRLHRAGGSSDHRTFPSDPGAFGVHRTSDHRGCKVRRRRHKRTVPQTV